MPGRDDVPPTEESITRLHRSGWIRDETAGTSIAGRIVFQVDARCGENQILVRADARRKARHRALEAAAAVGMLEGWPRRGGTRGRAVHGSRPGRRAVVGFEESG